MVYEVGYDFDGVLAVQPPDVGKPWRFMNGEQRKRKREWLTRWYTNAPELYKPPEKRFLVITARKNNEEVRNASLNWLKRHFPDHDLTLEMLSESRSIDNVVAFKTGVLQKYGVKDYTEDNIKVVTALRKNLPNIRIWHYKNGVLSI